MTSNFLHFFALREKFTFLGRKLLIPLFTASHFWVFVPNLSLNTVNGCHSIPCDMFNRQNHHRGSGGGHIGFHEYRGMGKDFVFLLEKGHSIFQNKPLFLEKVYYRSLYIKFVQIHSRHFFKFRFISQKFAKNEGKNLIFIQNRPRFHKNLDFTSK